MEQSSNESIRREEFIWTLSGGGAKGSFQAGAVLAAARAEFEGWFEPKLSLGTSTGSISAFALRSGVGAAAAVLCSEYLGLETAADVYERTGEARELERVDNFEIDFGALLTSPAPKNEFEVIERPPFLQFNVEDSITSAEALVGGFFGGFLGFFLGFGADIKDSIDDLQEVISRLTGLFDLAPIEARIRAAATSGDLPARLPYRLVNVDAETGVVGSVHDSGLFRQLTPNGYVTVAESIDPIDGVIASSSIPVVNPPRLLAGRYPCVDGGVRQVIPAYELLDAASQVQLGSLIGRPLDGSLVPVVVAASASWFPTTSPLFASSATAIGADVGATQGTTTPTIDLFASSLDTAVSQIQLYDDQVIALNFPRRIVIEPSVDVHATTQIDPGLIRINMTHGFLRGVMAFRRFFADPGDRELLNIDRDDRWLDLQIAARRMAWSLEDFGSGTALGYARLLKRAVWTLELEKLFEPQLAPLPSDPDLRAEGVSTDFSFGDPATDWERHAPGRPVDGDDAFTSTPTARLGSQQPLWQEDTIAYTPMWRLGDWQQTENRLDFYGIDRLADQLVRQTVSRFDSSSPWSAEQPVLLGPPTGLLALDPDDQFVPPVGLDASVAVGTVGRRTAIVYVDARQRPVIALENPDGTFEFSNVPQPPDAKTGRSGIWSFAGLTAVRHRRPASMLDGFDTTFVGFTSARSVLQLYVTERRGDVAFFWFEGAEPGSVPDVRFPEQTRSHHPLDKFWAPYPPPASFEPPVAYLRQTEANPIVLETAQGGVGKGPNLSVSSSHNGRIWTWDDASLDGREWHAGGLGYPIKAVSTFHFLTEYLTGTRGFDRDKRADLHAWQREFTDIGMLTRLEHPAVSSPDVPFEIGSDYVVGLTGRRTLEILDADEFRRTRSERARSAASIEWPDDAEPVGSRLFARYDLQGTDVFHLSAGGLRADLQHIRKDFDGVTTVQRVRLI